MPPSVASDDSLNDFIVNSSQWLQPHVFLIVVVERVLVSVWLVAPMPPEETERTDGAEEDGYIWSTSDDGRETWCRWAGPICHNRHEPFRPF